jgi:hypothetical protein
MAFTTRYFVLVIAFTVFGCRGAALPKSSSAISTFSTVNRFDKWYKSFVSHRDYRSCPQQIAEMDPRHDEQLDWTARERRFFVAMPTYNPDIATDVAQTPYVPALRECDVAINISHPRDIGDLESFSGQPPSLAKQNCFDAAYQYLEEYNEIRASRHPEAVKKLGICSSKSTGRTSRP